MTQAIKFWFLYIVEKLKWRQYNTTARHCKLYIFHRILKKKKSSNSLSYAKSSTADQTSHYGFYEYLKFAVAIS
jgi:hypothetical protein